MIDISGLPKSKVLAALFNAAAPQGMGMVFGLTASSDMTVEEAERIITSGQSYFDYLRGRPLKVNIQGNSFNPQGYDRDNGGAGTAERVIARLRETGVSSSNDYTANREDMTDQHAYDAPECAELGEVVSDAFERAVDTITKVIEQGIPEPRPGMTNRQHLDWASDKALERFDTDPRGAIALFMILIENHPSNCRITANPTTPMILQMGLSSRSEMERMMKGFAV